MNTHDPAARAWLPSANGHADFPLQNLPLGIFSTADGPKRLGTAIGDSIFDLKAALAAYRERYRHECRRQSARHRAPSRSERRRGRRPSSQSAGSLGERAGFGSDISGWQLRTQAAWRYSDRRAVLARR